MNSYKFFNVFILSVLIMFEFSLSNSIPSTNTQSFLQTKEKGDPPKEEPREKKTPVCKRRNPDPVVEEKPAEVVKVVVPHSDDDDDVYVYTKHIDIVEKFKRAKYPFSHGPDDLVLVPKKWFSFIIGLPQRKNPLKPRDDDEDDDDDNDDDDNHRNKKPRKNRCHTRRR